MQGESKGIANIVILPYMIILVLKSMGAVARSGASYQSVEYFARLCS